MRTVRRLLRVLPALAAVAVLTGTGVAAARTTHHHHSGITQRQLAPFRAVSAQFHSIANAEKAGYVLFSDVNGITCIDMPGMGGMGVHYVNPALIADPAIDPKAPEALVYAPDRDGTLRLAALEYLVDKATWDSTHTRAPHLFRGHPFDETDAPNRFGLADFYSQHVWAWKANPAGALAMWNPRVHCPA